MANANLSLDSFLNMPGNFLTWVFVSEIIGKIGFVSSSITGWFLIYLNLFCVRTTFGSYKYLMLIFTILGIAFATLEIVIYPNMHSFNSATLYFTLRKPLGLRKEILSASLVIYTGFYSATICLIAVQFIYRYWAVFDELKLRYYHGWYGLIWASYVLIFGAQWAIGAYNFVKTDKISEDYFREEILLRYNASIDELPSLAMVAFDSKNGNIRWWNIMTIVNMTFIMGIQYGIMIYCGWSMYSKMEDRLKCFSLILRNHHKQLFKTLILQISAPTIFLFIPLSFIIYLPFLNIQLSLPTGVFMSGFSLYPAVDSLVVMYVVADYRQNFKKIMNFSFKRVFLLGSNLVNPYETTATRTL